MELKFELKIWSSQEWVLLKFQKTHRKVQTFIQEFYQIRTPALMISRECCKVFITAIFMWHLWIFWIFELFLNFLKFLIDFTSFSSTCVCECDGGGWRNSQSRIFHFRFWWWDGWVDRQFWWQIIYVSSCWLDLIHSPMFDWIYSFQLNFSQNYKRR